MEIDHHPLFLLEGGILTDALDDLRRVFYTRWRWSLEVTRCLFCISLKVYLFRTSLEVYLCHPGPGLPPIQVMVGARATVECWSTESPMDPSDSNRSKRGGHE